MGEEQSRNILQPWWDCPDNHASKRSKDLVIPLYCKEAEFVDTEMGRKKVPKGDGGLKKAFGGRYPCGFVFTCSFYIFPSACLCAPHVLLDFFTSHSSFGSCLSEVCFFLLVFVMLLSCIAKVLPIIEYPSQAAVLPGCRKSAANVNCVRGIYTFDFFPFSS